MTTAGEYEKERTCSDTGSNIRTGTEVIGSTAEVVVVEQYEQVQAAAGSRSAAKKIQQQALRGEAAREHSVDNTYFSIASSESDMCGNWLWDCGRAKGCKLRHRTVYRLDAVREPVNFSLVVPKYEPADHTGRRVTRSTRRQQGASGFVRYILDRKLDQQIKQGLCAI